MEIKNARLFSGGAPVPFVRSPNQGGRIEPTLIVLHDTSDRLKPNDSVEWFKNPSSRVSAHFVVGRDGSIVQMVDCDRRAQHAGKSSWRGRKECNGFSIGIEIDNPGRLIEKKGRACAWFGECFSAQGMFRTDGSNKTHGPGLWMPYPDAQLAAVEQLCRAILAAYPSVRDIAGHFEVSPGRKVDPGPQFPMDRFRALCRPVTVDEMTLVRRAQLRLSELGYAHGPADGVMGPNTRAALRTFQEQNDLPVTGQLSPETVKAMVSAQARPMPTGATETMTARDVADEGSTTIPRASMQKRVAEVTAAATLASAAADTAQTVNSATAAINEQRSAMDGLLDVAHWLVTPKGVLTVVVIGACLSIWLLANRIEWRRVIAARLNIHLGG